MRDRGANLGRGARKALVTAFLLPYLLLQSIAAGVMPAVGDDGLTFVICTGEQPSEARLLPDGSYDFDPADNSDGHDRTCPWAVAHAPADLAAHPDLSAPEQTAHSTDLPQSDLAVLPGGERLSPPSRAPPLRA